MTATLHDPLTAILSIALKRSDALIAGYYAIDDKRYRLDLPNTGKWRGWMFLKTGSDYHSQRRIVIRKPDGSYACGTTDHGLAVLAAILADPMAALKAYGDITNTCAICGRKLECPVSVKFGIGPTCLRHMLESLTQ